TVARRVMDISAFLQNIEWPEDLALEPLAKRVAVHDPCTLTNVQRAHQAPYALLRRIPQMEILPLPENKTCCGAAGAYHLEHPEMAQALRQDKIRHVAQTSPDILVTSNVGCAMHLYAGLRQAGTPIEVMHPVTLIAKQLPSA